MDTTTERASQSVRAYAKINLGLRILGRRPDGYHELETIFQQIDLHDVLTVSSSERKNSLACTDPDCPTNEQNLILKAVQLLQSHAGCEKSVHIQLDKKIPIGAGLGGGSSDAAATLIALNAFWQLHLPLSTLLQLAGQIGSDVPFFLLGGSCLGTGRGEKLAPLDMPCDYFGLLIYPHFSISTRWAYENANFDLTKTLKNSKFYSLTDHIGDFARWQTSLINDLEQVVLSRYSELASLIAALREHGAFYARMSGSGSSIFGLFDSSPKAQQAFDTIDRKYFKYLFRPMKQVA